MKMVRLLGSRVMAEEGFYRLEKIGQKQFVKLLVEAEKSGELVSYVSYDSALEFLQRISRVGLKRSVEITELENGDQLLVCSTKYRFLPSQKRQQYMPADEDYEFWKGIYFSDWQGMKKFMEEDEERLTSHSK
jgi:hypothetical protein